MIGICGLGGIGKTTLAKAIYNLMYIHFESSCFCDDVQGVAKRHGITQVQMQLFNNIMKTRDVKILNISEGIMVIKQRMTTTPILLVLDDVDHLEQLEALAGSADWFFPGSVIIFTSKNKQLLRSHQMDEIHDVEFLDDSKSLELFSWHAFCREHPTKDFEKLAEQVVQYVQGHPLALKVLGRFLYGKTLGEWKSELEGLQLYPNEEIQRVFRLSYDGLNLHQQRILLDIACSFVGVNRDLAASVLDSCNYFADTNMRVLVDKSLITVSRTNSLQMHDLIQAMAREIVYEESKTPGKRSRLWIPSEVYDVLSENKVTEAVEALVILLKRSSQKVHIDGKAFADMKKLRILKIWDPNRKYFGHDFDMKDFNVKFSGSLDFLSNELRLLYWHGCPFKYLPSKFYPNNIVAVDFSYSQIKSLWTTPKCFTKLKVMNLSHCHNLTRTPDFTEFTNLEELLLEGCVNLVKVHPSIGMLKRLAILNMRNCKHVKSFHFNFEMSSLQVLRLSGCLKMDKLPEVIGRMKTLVELYIDRTAITELPYFVSSLKNLQVLSFGRYERIMSKLQYPRTLVLSSLEDLCMLRHVNLCHCNILQVSQIIGSLSYLESLFLDGNDFTSLPGSLSQLSRLRKLGVNGCKKLEVLPKLPPSIDFLGACDCTSLRELHGLLDHSNTFILCCFIGCPKLFTNLTFDSSMTSDGSRNQLFSFLEYMCIESNICRIFREHESRVLDLDIIYHGNRIPQWFTNQSMGNRVKVELPSDWCYDKFRGYGFCVVFKPKTSYSSKAYYGQPGYVVNNFDGAYLDDVYPFSYSEWKDVSIGIHESDMILLHYTTDKWRWKEANKFVTFSFIDNEDVEVKECGVRLICDEDVQEDMDLSMIRNLPTPTQDGGTFTLYAHNMINLWW